MRNLDMEPYGGMGRNRVLLEGNTFVEDYSLAFELASNLDIPDLDETTEVIREVVDEALGPDEPPIRILAVSGLVATARTRALRRPLVRNQKELRHERHRVLPPISVKSLKKERALLNEQVDIYKEQRACYTACASYLKEATALILSDVEEMVAKHGTPGQENPSAGDTQ